ncbi:hypothetical protein AB0B88_16310 [Micromonospora haikouensis]|uniref:hypothetical protein n=1 Tax=Micromonospora haikouensis TaxID=686309 RepID=UPI0033ECDFD6
MPYYLYRDVDDDRLYAYDEPQPDIAARPGWTLEADQGTPEALAAIARLEAQRARDAREAALIALATAERLSRAAAAYRNVTVTEDPGAESPIRRVRLAYDVTGDSAPLEEVRVGPDPGEVTARRNEWGGLGGTPPDEQPDAPLVQAVTRAGLTSGQNGCAVEIRDPAGTATVYGRRWRDGTLLRNGLAMADVLVLSAAAAVPAGTPPGTVIVRRTA